MDIRIYDINMAFAGVVDNLTSLIWTRRYQEPGEFQITAPITAENVRLMRRGRLVWKNGAADCGIIEAIELTETTEDLTMTVTGRFLTCLLERRLIGGGNEKPMTTWKLKNAPILTAYEEMLKACSPLCIPSDGISLVTDFPTGGESVSIEATLRQLLAYYERLCRATGYGMRIRPDFARKQLHLEVWQGTDHSSIQSENGVVVFAKTFDNLTGATWTEDDTDARNTVYLVYQNSSGEGSTCDMTVNGDMISGIQRRETRLDYSGGREEGTSYSEYQREARNYALQQLRTSLAPILSMESTTAPDVSFVYGRDYDLGDIVTVRVDDWGIEQDLRLMEISEVYENGTYTLNPTFGDPLPQVVEWDDSDK